MPHPLLALIEAGDADGLRRALAAGADPRATDDEDVPLALLAAETGRVELVAPFVEGGLPIDHGDRLGITLLHAAVMTGAAALPLVAWLLARGADPDRMALDDDDAKAPLHSALEGGDGGAIVRALVRAGADVDARRGDGWTPLMLASHAGDAALVELLLDAGADVHATRSDGQVSAVAIAVHRQHAAVLALLRAHGAEDPIAAACRRLRTRWAAIDRALVAAGRPASVLAGASPAAVAELARALGRDLPAEVQAHFLAVGAAARLPLPGGFAVISPAASLDAHHRLERLARDGAFAGAAPRELRAGSGIRPVWWHPAWLPFAEDSGGNLRCVDLDPAGDGVFGQVIGWEVHAGPVGPIARSLEEYVRTYEARARRGALRFDADAGIVD